MENIYEKKKNIYKNLYNAHRGNGLGFTEAPSFAPPPLPLPLPPSFRVRLELFRHHCRVSCVLVQLLLVLFLNSLLWKDL